MAAFRADADKALETMRNQPAKEISGQLAAGIEAASKGLKEQLADREKKLAERDKVIADLQKRVNNAAIRAAAHESKILASRLDPQDRPLIEREIIHAGYVNEEGRVCFRDDNGATFYGPESQPATVDEAIPQLMERIGIDPKKKLITLDARSGSGAMPGAAGHAGQTNPWKKEFWNVTEQCRITRENPAMAASMKQAAGR